MTPQEHYDKSLASLEESRKEHEKRMDEADKRHEQAMKRIEEAGQLSHRRHEEAMLRMDKAEQLSDRRHEKAMRRLDKIDHQLEVTSKLVQAGIKLVRDMIQEQKAAKAEMAELRKSTKAFMDWWQRGNGNGHRGNGKK